MSITLLMYEYLIVISITLLRCSYLSIRASDPTITRRVEWLKMTLLEHKVDMGVIKWWLVHYMLLQYRNNKVRSPCMIQKANNVYPQRYAQTTHAKAHCMPTTPYCTMCVVPYLHAFKISNVAVNASNFIHRKVTHDPLPPTIPSYTYVMDWFHK